MDGTTVKVSFDNGKSDTFVYDKESDTLDYGGVMEFTK